MSLAEDLISSLTAEEIQKGQYFKPVDLLSLRPKQGVLIGGKRAVVIDVNKRGSDIEFTYVKGRRVFGKEVTLVLKATGPATNIQPYTNVDPYTAEDVIEDITKGMKNAYSKMENSKVCVSCQLTVPRYPGRYPGKCPGCGDELEDLQNSPRYSEQSDYNKAWNRQMRLIPKDRIGGE